MRSVVGAFLALGFLYRDAIHIGVAMLDERDPHLADKTDVTLESPVPSLRSDGGHWVARIMCVAFAGTVAAVASSLLGSPQQAGIGGYWLVANWSVVAIDPLFGIIAGGWAAVGAPAPDESVSMQTHE